MGGVSNALAKSAIAKGAEIYTDQVIIMQTIVYSLEMIFYVKIQK